MEKKIKCGDRNCPFHGSLNARGRCFIANVKKIIGTRAVVEIERLVYSKKYESYAKARTKLHAHIPACLASQLKQGCLVKISECRPLSKIVHFVVLEILK